MSQVILTLGGVPFHDFEVPEKITIEGSQRLAVHPLIGGGQVVDVLGTDDGDICFSGIFSGSDAAARTHALDTARALGAAIPLVWDGFFYWVVIAKYTADYAKPWWIPFSIRCAVIVDPASLAAALAAPLAALVESDIASALSLSAQAGLRLISPASPSYAGLAAAQAALGGGVLAAGGVVGAASAQISGAVDPQTGVNALGIAVSGTGQLAALRAASGYLGRASANLVEML